MNKPLKAFNKDIEIVVSVDSIAESLLATMNPDNPHATLVVETIIGQALSNGRMNDLSRLFNALSGISQKVNFTVGQELYCNSSIYDHKDGSNGNKSRETGACMVVAIDPLKDSFKVQIGFDYYMRSNEVSVRKEWVSIDSLRELTDADCPEPTDDREPEEKTGE